MVKLSEYRLRTLAQLSLFLSSYIPLFILLIVKGLLDNSEFLNWGGLNLESFALFIQCFGLSTLLSTLCLLGAIGTYILFKNLKTNHHNGEKVKIIDIDNHNSEIISYISTYIVPLLFTNMENTYEILSITFILVIIYRIYIKSKMIMINPILSFWFSIYEIVFIDNSKMTKKGLVISRNDFIEESEEIKISSIGYKLYYTDGEANGIN